MSDDDLVNAVSSALNTARMKWQKHSDVEPSDWDIPVEVIARTAISVLKAYGWSSKNDARTAAIAEAERTAVRYKTVFEQVLAEGKADKFISAYKAKVDAATDIAAAIAVIR